jgi:hypothetical protein
MAFDYTIRTSDFLGKGIVLGNWSATGVTTGTIKTGFSKAEHASISNVVANTNTVAYSGGNVEITCTSGDSGTFLIYGS